VVITVASIKEDNRLAIKTALEKQAANKRAARQVVHWWATKKDWGQHDVDEVVGALGLDLDPTMAGMECSGQTFNSKPG
jgi:hypothetical protein